MECANLLTNLLLPAILLTSGCATVETKEVVNNSQSYLSQNFTPSQIDPSVRLVIEKGPPLPTLFRTMKVTYSIDYNEAGRISQRISNYDFKNLGNGYIQVRSEVLNNSIPYRINLNIGFAGISYLKTQTVFLGRSNALQPIEVKEIKRFDRSITLPIKGKTYKLEYKTGYTGQIMNFKDENVSCTAEDTQPASLIFPTLTGNAIPLTCSVVGQNNVVTAKLRYAWLEEYGIALEQESATAQQKAIFKINALTVIR